MNVFVKLNEPIGSGILGFNISSDGGIVVPSYATKGDLITGIYVVVNDIITTTITLTPVGSCSMYSVILPITGIPGTTTTTTETPVTTSTTTETPTTTTTEPTTTTTEPTTTTTTTNTDVACGGTYSYAGGETYPTTKIITLGSSTGLVTLNFNAFDIPDKFKLIYDGSEVINTGYRGDIAYSTDLLNALTIRYAISLDPNDDPGAYENTIQGVGSGTASFNKTTPITTATLLIYAPLSGTAWNFTLSCPV